MAQPWLHSGMRVKIEQIHDLLMALPPSSSVSITRPDELAKELFTHRVRARWCGAARSVRCETSWDALDLPRLQTLIESGFGRKLAPDYFERTQPYRVFVCEHYRAALMLTVEEGIPHLDKFAVADDAQGEGLGRAIWHVMRDDMPRLFWRARPETRSTSSISRKPTAASRASAGTCSGTALDAFDDIRIAVEHCRERPATVEAMSRDAGRRDAASASSARAAMPAPN